VNGVVVLGIVVGFWVVPTAARFNPTLVNGLLLLILVGIVLGNSSRWTPILSAFSSAVSEATRQQGATEKAKAPSPVGQPAKL
jgi:hypothetical protein